MSVRLWVHNRVLTMVQALNADCLIVRRVHATTFDGLGRLVSYDLLILRRSAQAAFSRKRDILLLLVALALGFAIVLQRVGETLAAIDAWPMILKAGLAAAAAWATNLTAARRLAHLREDSLVARFALKPAEARAHVLLWNMPALCTAGGLVLISSNRPQALVAIAGAYIIGTGFAAAQRAAVRRSLIWSARRRLGTGGRRLDLGAEARRERIVQLLVARTGPPGPHVSANLLACAGTGLLIGAGHAWLATQLQGAAAAALATAAALLVLLLLLRTHPPLLRYLLFLGDEPLLPALVATSLAGAFIAGMLIGLAANPPAPPPMMLAGAGAILLLFLAAVSLRTLHFAARSRQMAEFAIQVDLLAAGLAALLAPPLAPAILVARLWVLRRQARALRYQLR